MDVKKQPNLRLPFLRALLFVLPLALCVLFSLTKGNRAWMDLWVYGIMGPFEQFLGRIWSFVPISGMELWIASALVGSIFWILRAFVLLLQTKDACKFLRRLLSYVTLCLWVLAAFNWLWNAAYYASSFSQRSGLIAQPYTVEELAEVTDYFADNAARLSTQVSRDSKGRFAEDIASCFRRGPGIYDTISNEFPCLSMQSVQAKPIFFSRLQSRLGFTGMYFPFTGEANVNVDAPSCLVPATIAHEMAHQRMVASEQEANFVGIAAAVTSSDPVFQYSGYLQGLIQTCNALYPVAPELWNGIAARRFTPELAADWSENNAYWTAMESPVEEVAERTYDTYLKSNDQQLGIRSYGACVDLLVAYFGPLCS